MAKYTHVITRGQDGSKHSSITLRSLTNLYINKLSVCREVATVMAETTMKNPTKMHTWGTGDNILRSIATVYNKPSEGQIVRYVGGLCKVGDCSFTIGNRITLLQLGNECVYTVHSDMVTLVDVADSELAKAWKVMHEAILNSAP